MITKIYIGNDQLDLHSDESIQVVSSVADIEDITKNTTDYSRTFTVPASAKNNRIFKHWFNANIDNTFDARTKVAGRIELGGYPFRTGKFRLSKVSVKGGRPSDYTIIFFGLTINLKLVLKDDLISGLTTLSKYNHEYSSGFVKIGLETGLGFQISYVPFAKRRYYYSSNPTDNTITDEVVNIAWQDGAGNNGIVWNDLHPSLRVIAIIEEIEVKYGITFSRDFFGLPEFTGLFCWVNPSIDITLPSIRKVITYNSGATDNVDFATGIGTFITNEAIADQTTFWEMSMNIDPDPTYDDVLYSLRFVDSELGVIASHSLTGNQTVTVQLSNPVETTRTVWWEIGSSNPLQFNANWTQVHKLTANPDIATFQSFSQGDSTSQDIDIPSNLPKIKIIDFLRGLFKAFKLVIIATDENTYYVDTFNTYYAKGISYDITRFVDTNNYDVERGKIFNEINYIFEEPKTKLNIEYEKNNFVGYGDAEILLKDELGEPLDGSKTEIKVPFEQIVYERLIDGFNGEQTDIQVGNITNDNGSPANPKFHIFYKGNVTGMTKSVGFINDVGTKEELTQVNLPLHVNDILSPQYSTVFENNFDEYTGNRIENTLFSNYHEEYLLSIFNIKKRDFKFKAKLPLNVKLNLKLNDILKIKSNYYRIDKFTSDLTQGTDVLNLISTFIDIEGGFSAFPLNFLITYEAQQVDSTVTKLGNFSFNKIDNGFGVDWVTVTNSETKLFFDVTENPVGSNRDINIKFTDLDTFFEFTIYINQKGFIALASSNIITADSDEITADNG